MIRINENAARVYFTSKVFCPLVYDRDDGGPSIYAARGPWLYTVSVRLYGCTDKRVRIYTPWA